MKKKFLFFVLFVVNAMMYSQVKFYARVLSREITTDDRLRISFIAEGTTRKINDGRMETPTFDGFRAMGPFVSQEFSYINGHSAYKKSYTYTLQPEKTGTLIIKPAKFSVDGEVYETQAIKIKVTKGNRQPAGINNQITASSDKANKESKKDILLIAQVSKNNPYLNEAVGVTYRLYIPKRFGVQNYQEISQPQYNGFWAQDVDRQISGPFEGTLNGKEYVYYILKKKLLFPQQTGKLKIKPLTLSIDIQKPVIRQMGFMQIRDYEVERIQLSSGTKTIQVKDLPKKNKPLNFTGAVGQFDFSVQVDKNEVKTGEPVSIALKVKGLGNLKLFDLPKLKTSEDLEVYEPKHSENIQTTFSGNKGWVKDVYLVIPNKSGKFIIPGLSFSYFDPKQQKYITQTTDNIVILAKGNDAYTQNQTIENSSDNFIGNDFRFIKEKAQFKPKNKAKFYQSRSFYVLILLAFAGAFLALGYKKFWENRVYDEGKVRQKQRKTLANKYLKQAKSNLNNNEKFYANLEKAINYFLKAKLDVDTAGLSKSKIEQILKEKNIDSKDISQFMDILNKCEMARYSPADISTLEKDLQQTEQLLKNLDKSL